MGIGSAVIRPLKDALDGMPVHMKQLAEMFRKHAQKQNRNNDAVTDLDSADVTHPLGNNTPDARPLPYSDPSSRPSFRQGVVELVFENARDPDGLVRDPNTGDVIDWTPGDSRVGVWDMGHIPGQKYSDMHARYMNGEFTPAEFRDWYNDASHYVPELPGNNRSHLYE